MKKGKLLRGNIKKSSGVRYLIGQKYSEPMKSWDVNFDNFALRVIYNMPERK